MTWQTKCSCFCQITHDSSHLPKDEDITQNHFQISSVSPQSPQGRDYTSSSGSTKRLRFLARMVLARPRLARRIRFQELQTQRCSADVVVYNGAISAAERGEVNGVGGAAAAARSSSWGRPCSDARQDSLARGHRLCTTGHVYSLM